MHIRLLSWMVGLGALVLAGPSAAYVLFSTPDSLAARRAATDEIEWLRDAASGDAIALQLPGAVVTGELDRSAHRSPESFSWYGLLSEPPGEFQLTVHRGRIVGIVSALGLGSFEIRSDGNGLPRFLKVDPRNSSGCEVVLPPEGDYAEPSPGKGVPDDGSVIDVLVIYTPGAKNEAGGTADVEAVIVAAMDQGNFSFANSGIAPRLRLVHMAELPYTESGDCLTDLEHFQKPYDGYMDEFLTLRDTYGADLCTLITESGNCCGIGYLMQTPALGFANFAVSVTVLSCALGHTFVHELGHNLGACHARGDGDEPCGGSSSYSVGHRFDGNSGTEWRTVMAYYPGIRISHFSNPDALFDGVPTGVPIGELGEAHNAATINANAWHGANFRWPSVCNDSIPSVTLTAPSDGEILCTGTSQTVSWTSSDESFYNFVVELSTDGGSSWSIQGEGSRDGSSADFTWTAPFVPVADGRIRVTVTNCAGSSSDSHAVHVDEGAPVAALQSFMGGETVCAVGYSEILWVDAFNCEVEATSWSIEYSTDAGGSWSEIAAGAGTGGGSQPWLVPNTPTNEARVRVILSNPAGVDSASSFSNFTIVPPGTASVVVQSPNGGEVWPAGSQHLISWTNTGCDAGATRISYSPDGGASFTLEHTEIGVDPGVYLWTVPWDATDQAVVSVEQFNGGGSDVDTSDATFSILGPPQPTLEVPAGGEVWVVGTTHTVLWTNVGGTATSHTVEYSTDGGSDWLPIALDVPGPGSSLDWTLPSSLTAFARVRVSLDNPAGTVTSESPGDFTIAAQHATAGPAATMPVSYRLGTAAPNPFRQITSIQMDLPAANLVTLRVYNLAGRLVRTVENRRLGAGPHNAVWDGRDSEGRGVAPGIYFARMRAGDFTATRKLVRLK